MTGARIVTAPTRAAINFQFQNLAKEIVITNINGSKSMSKPKMCG